MTQDFEKAWSTRRADLAAKAMGKELVDSVAYAGSFGKDRLRICGAVDGSKRLLPVKPSDLRAKDL